MPRWFVALAIPLILLGVLVSTQRAVSAHLGADLLYVVDVYRDLFVNRYPINHLYFTPTSFAIPDLVLICMALFVSRDPGRAFFLYELIFFALFTLSLNLWFKSLSIRLRGLLCGTLLLFLGAIIGAHPSTLVFFLPIYHAGSTLAGVFLLSMVVRSVRVQWRKRDSFLAVMLLALASLSDLFFVTQFVLPVLLALHLTGRHHVEIQEAARRWFRFCIYAALIHLAALCALTSLAGVQFLGNPLATCTKELLLTSGFALGVLPFLRTKWNQLKPFVTVPVFRISIFCAIVLTICLIGQHARSCFISQVPIPAGWPAANLQHMARDLGMLAARDPQLWIWPIVAVALSIVVLRDKLADRYRKLMAAFFLISLGITLLEAGLTWVGLGTMVQPKANIFDEGTIRYLQPAYVLPIFVVAALVRWPIVGPRLRSVVVSGLLGIALIAAGKIVSATPAIASTLISLPYPDYASCFDELVEHEHLHAGYGDYWAARQLRLLSHHPVPINVLLGSDFSLRAWENNPAWYLPEPGDPDPYLRYDFLVHGRFKMEHIVERFGVPARTERCGEFEISIYDRQTDLTFRQILHVAALTANGAAPPSHLVSHPTLNVHRDDGVSDETAGTIPVGSKGQILSFERATYGNVIEISASATVPLELNVFDGQGALVARLIAPVVAGSGLAARFLRLPTSSSVETVEVTTTSANARLGHLFVYSDVN